jgi:hypothetical protein
MTYQIRDGISIEGKQYAIERSNNREGLFNPNNYSIHPGEASSACHRGFYCDYTISDRQLLLMSISLNPNMSDRLKFKYGRSEKLLFGQSPELNKFPVGLSWTYQNLHHSIPYSGGLLLVAGNIMMRSENMMYYPTCLHERVCEAIFELGILIDLIDYSDRMTEIRNQIIEDGEKEISMLGYWYKIEHKILAEYFHHQY